MSMEHTSLQLPLSLARHLCMELIPSHGFWETVAMLARIFQPDSDKAGPRLCCVMAFQIPGHLTFLGPQSEAA